MAQISIWGDFKINQVEHLSISEGLGQMLDTSDINVCNFEAPIRTNAEPLKKSGPNHFQHIDAPKWLIEHGFNLISMANNHTMDFGYQGLCATRNAFGNVATVGCGSWEEAYSIKVVDTKDKKRIGFIACTHLEFGTLTEKGDTGCAWALSPSISKIIVEGKDTVDALVVISHAGVEYMDMPLPEWRDVYKQWIDLGADAVIASHPHVPQGWEIYKGKPICYSLGNFCFETTKRNIPNHWFESLCCILKITDAHRIEMQIHPLKYDNVKHYISGNDSKCFLEHLQWMNDILSDDDAYKREVDIHLNKIYPRYMGMFSRGGFITGLFQMNFVKGFVDGLMGRGFYNKVHALNNMQCESHRWAIIRVLKKKEHIK